MKTLRKTAAGERHVEANAPVADALEAGSPEHGDARSKGKGTALLSKGAALAVWGAVAVISLSTLSPLAVRPTTGLGADVERAGAYMLLGSLVALAYPKHRRGPIIWMLGLIVALEVLQLTVSDRHARIGDMMVKAIGALAGLHLGRILSSRLGRRGARHRP